MFGFIKKMFIRLLSFDGLLAMKCVSMSNKPCQRRATVIDINSSEPHYYPFTVSVYKCGKSCNTIYDPSARICVPEKVNNMNKKKFNLMSVVIYGVFWRKRGQAFPNFEQLKNS